MKKCIGKGENVKNQSQVKLLWLQQLDCMHDLFLREWAEKEIKRVSESVEKWEKAR